MKSIIQKDKECFWCFKRSNLESHHIYSGKNRDNSEKYGLKVWLCHKHHRGEYWAHGRSGKYVNRHLRRIGQIHFEKEYPDLSFADIFGRNYINKNQIFTKNV